MDEAAGITRNDALPAAQMQNVRFRVRGSGLSPDY
jgi:hypothetical protein